MKTTTNLVYLTLFTALGTACPVEQDLGETASSSSSGGDSGSDSGSTSGSGETGVLDTGPWSGTSDGTTGSGDTGVLDTGPWSSTGDETEGSTTGEPVTCEPGDTMVTWDWTTIGPAQLGYDSLFVGVGSCSVTGEDVSDSQLTLAMQCTLTGTRDDMPFLDQPIAVDLTFDFEGGAPALPSLWPTLSARFFVGPVGFNPTGERFVVLEQPMLPNDGDAPVIIATDSSLGLQPPAEHFAGDWYDDPGFNAVPASCESGDVPECTQDVAIEAGWLDEVPVSIHGTESATFGAPTEGGSYEVFVSSAWEAVGPCPDDFPVAEYAFVAFGATP